MNILVACEESQRVTIELRKLGHNAYSCDIEPCSGGHPEWHIQKNVLKVLNPTYDGEAWLIDFVTMDDEIHVIEKWDMIIAHPPCTYLTVTGNRWFNVEKYGDRAIEREKKRIEAIDFFMAFVNADCEKIAVENPIGTMSTAYRKPDQIIHPFQFGDPQRKATCLWLKGLPPLKPTDIVTPEIIHYKNGKGTDSPWHMDTMSLPPKERAKARSKTYWGIAKAIAEQWAGNVIESGTEKSTKNEIEPKYLCVLEKQGWSVCCYTGDGRVELEKYSPAGEDFVICVDVENFPASVSEYAGGFDIDDHIAMWIKAKESGTSGVPSTRELVKDAEDIAEMLKVLAAALYEVEDGCPHGGDTANDCEGCSYSGDYHFDGGECVRRQPCST